MSVKNSLMSNSKKKRKFPCDFLIDEIDLDSYFFHNLLDNRIVQNRALQLSRGLIRKFTQSKSLILNHALTMKDSNLLLYYTREEKNIFPLEKCNYSKNRVIKFQRLFWFPNRFLKLSKLSAKIFVPSLVFEIFKDQNFVWLSL